MIKILHIMPVLAYGGVEKIVRSYYEVMDHQEYHFDFVTHGGVESYHNDIITEGSKIFYLPTVGSAGIVGYIKKIRECINVQEYDCVHVHTGDLTGIYAFAYKVSGARFVICHAHTAKAIGKKRRCFEGALRFIANCESNFRFACGKEAGDFCFGKNKYMVLPNAINAKKFNDVSSEQIESVKQSLGIPDNRCIIGHVGAMIDQKNQLFLLEVYAAALRERRDLFLVLVGDGPNRTKVEEKVAELGLNNDICLTGIRNDVNVLMKTFDIFAFPSLFEGLPVVGIEAQTAGVPCLFSDQIDVGVDIGCKLCTFLPIDKGNDVWVRAIINQITNKIEKPTTIEIEKALSTAGFSIFETKKILEKEYSSLIRMKN